MKRDSNRATFARQGGISSHDTNCVPKPSSLEKCGQQNEFRHIRPAEIDVRKKSEMKERERSPDVRNNISETA